MSSAGSLAVSVLRPMKVPSERAAFSLVRVMHRFYDSTALAGESRRFAQQGHAQMLASSMAAAVHCPITPTLQDWLGGE